MNDRLSTALSEPLWQSHLPQHRYTMDGKGNWKIAYYPILGCGKTGIDYDEPRALIEQDAIFKGVRGIDFREIPLRYLERINQQNEDTE